MHTVAAKRYQRRMTVVSLVYVALVAANAGISRLLDPSPLALGIMAVVTGLPIVAMLAVLGRYLREETDEFVRDRLIVSMLFALGVLLSATSIVGLLQFEGLVGKVPVFLAFPLWCGVWGLAQGWLSWRDKRAEDTA